MRADGKLICLCIFTKDHYFIPVGAVQQTWCEQSSYACTYSCKITIQSENPLPRYVSGQKYVTDGRTDGRTNGKALDRRTTPKQYPTPKSIGGG